MKKLHMSIAPRLAMRNEIDPVTGQSTLVPSIDRTTGEQDISVVGTLVSIKPNAIEYIRTEDGTTGIAYQGRSLVNIEGEEKEVPVLINGSAIDNVTVGQSYWLTERASKDGLYTNYSQGSLSAEPPVSASVAINRRAMLMAQKAKIEAEATETP